MPVDEFNPPDEEMSSYLFPPELPPWPGFHPTVSSEDLARLEAKIDRLLELLEAKKGLWIAPAPDEDQGHYTGIQIGGDKDK